MRRSPAWKAASFTDNPFVAAQFLGIVEHDDAVSYQDTHQAHNA